MSVELWHIPVLVMAAIAIPMIVYEIIGRRPDSVVRTRVRTYGLVGLSAVMLVLLVVAVRALGTSTVANAATIASAITEIVVLWLTYESYKELKDAKVPKPAPDDIDVDRTVTPTGT